ncbi:T9SS type A sorting domain-containing protein [bacterium]|nr:T9SS type A sorting domain-containing protein [bacterium]
MRTVALLLCVILTVGVANAQMNPPTGLTSTHDGDGHVELNWNSPNVLGATSWQDLVDWPESDVERAEWEAPNFDEVRSQWEALQSQGNQLDDLQFFFVYRNGQQLDITYDTQYEDVLPSENTYVYTVTAFYDLGESNHSNEVTVTWFDQVATAIDEDFNDGEMPDGWTVEATIASHTWEISSNNNLFPTPYALVDSDAAGNNPPIHLQERLLLPPFDFSETSFVEFVYSSNFVEYVDEHGYVQYRIANGDWVTINDINQDGEQIGVTHDLTAELAGESDVDLSFFYDDMTNWGFYWGIDDVEVSRDYVPSDPVRLEMIGRSNIIPADGGWLGFDVHFISTLPNTVQNVKYWTTITMPDGTESDRLALTTFTHTPNMDVLYEALQQEIPANAPAGEYFYNGYVGLSLNNPQIEGSFRFVKLPSENTDGAGEFVFDPSEWELLGLPGEVTANGEIAVNLPSDYELDLAYPNPFNAMTSLTLRLPEVSPVTVAVYNVMGQQVATLAKGSLDAGVHNLSFDASDLASGIYFVRASVPGQLNHVQKLVLMK